MTPRSAILDGTDAGGRADQLAALKQGPRRVERPSQGPTGRRRTLGKGKVRGAFSSSELARGLAFWRTACLKEGNRESRKNMPRHFKTTFMLEIVRGVLILLLSTGVFGCELLGFPEWEWRQKLTVEVETPSGPITASSVITVTCKSSPKWLRGLGGGGLSCFNRGEAVPVEIAPGNVLFALLKKAPGSTNYPEKVAYHVFFPNRELTTVKERSDQLERGIQGVQTLPKENYPLLVTFSDITKPKTVQKVDPDNLKATFGPGVSLKRLTLEITNEPVTEGKIEEILRWLNSVHRLVEPKSGALLKDTPVEHRLNTLDFRRK